MTVQRLLYWLFTSLFVATVLGGMVGVFAGALVGWIVGILCAGACFFYMCSEENVEPPRQYLSARELWDQELGRRH